MEPPLLEVFFLKRHKKGERSIERYDELGGINQGAA
jgi:hypothetical protein